MFALIKINKLINIKLYKYTHILNFKYVFSFSV